jgi:DNA-binding CsgD family transcriptional regulator
MRQAVVNFGYHIIEEWGLEAFHDAGVVDADILSCEGPRGVCRLHVEEEPDANRLDESDVIEWWEQVSDEGAGHVYLFEGRVPDPVDGTVSSDERYPLTEHVDISGRGITLTYTGSQDRISNEVAAIESAGIDVTLKQLRGYRVEETGFDPLTDRQQELVELAFDHGYYDVPRATTTKELADEIELDDSTVSEHLRRAERNLIASALGHAR